MEVNKELNKQLHNKNRQSHAAGLLQDTRTQYSQIISNDAGRHERFVESYTLVAML